MFHLLQPPPPPCFLYFHAFVSLSMSPCIILLKAWLLPVTVGEHVACGRHNLTVLFPVPAEAGRARSFLFVCLLSCLCVCIALFRTPLFLWHMILFPDPLVVRKQYDSLYQWLQLAYMNHFVDSIQYAFTHTFSFVPVGFYVCLCLCEYCKPSLHKKIFVSTHRLFI